MKQAAEVASSTPTMHLTGHRLKGDVIGVVHPEFRDELITNDHLAIPHMIKALKTLDRQGKAPGWWDRNIEEVYS